MIGTASPVTLFNIAKSMITNIAGMKTAGDVKMNNTTKKWENSMKLYVADFGSYGATAVVAQNIDEAFYKIVQHSANYDEEWLRRVLVEYPLTAVVETNELPDEIETWSDGEEKTYNDR